MIKLLKAGEKVFGYIWEIARPLTDDERKEAGIILPHEYQQLKNERMRAALNAQSSETGKE